MLRDYQVDAIDRARKSYATGHKRPMLMAPTGAGKTQIAIQIIRNALSRGKRVLFTVDRVQLIDQTAKVFFDAGLDFGVMQADHPLTRSRAPVQLASIQTLTKRIMPPRFDLVINDEAHVTYEKMTALMELWQSPCLGLSATPFTKGLGKIYDDLIVVSTTQELIDQGYLSDFAAYGSMGVDLSGIKMQSGDYNQKQLGERVNKTAIIGDVVTTWLRRGENRQTLCFAVNVAHSKAIVDEFQANGVTAEHMDAHTPDEERKEILERYESGKTKILSNCGITTKGFDSPNTDCLIMARPTKSLALYIQMVGRVLRVGDKKTTAIILDHGGNIERLGFPTDELPRYLCHGEKGKSQAQEREKKERLPTPCEACHFLHTQYVCPSCGHVPERMPNVISTNDQLQKLEQANRSEKDDWYGMLLGYARENGFQDGWASHKFKEKFGMWPERKTNAKQPDSRVTGFLMHERIKKSKRGKKDNPHATPQPGFDYTWQTATDGSKRIRVEQAGKFVCWAPQNKATKEAATA